MDSNKTKTDVLRLIACCIILCLLMITMFICFAGGMEKIGEKLEDIDKYRQNDMKNTVWFIRHAMMILPVILLVAISALLYSTQKDDLSYIKHKEQLIEMLVVFIFTFAVILPFVVIYTQKHPPMIDSATGEKTLTLFARTAEWFVWQFIIFIVPLMYHRIRMQDDEILSEFEEYNMKNEETEQ
ncbi:MAG: hypothetical protein E7667_03230 [Ruminococcaceae bacterium]|nr:hypothetical protein [Oscillospiraceae bacterium]